MPFHDIKVIFVIAYSYSKHWHELCVSDLVDATFSVHAFFFELHWVIIGFISVRLNETQYSVNSIGDNGLAINDLKRLDQNSGAENSCLPSGLLKHTKQPDFCGAPGSQFSERGSKRHTTPSSLSGQSFYVDVDVPAELRSKVGLDLLLQIHCLPRLNCFYCISINI